LTISASQALNDLDWVVSSPSLADDPLAVPPVPLDRSAVDADHLADFLASRQEHRVGRYFEHLLSYWFRHVRQVEMIEEGVHIRDEQNRTLGEMDFLFRDEDGVLNHCEATVKFFLHYPNDQGSHFPGPAARDNFERKATRLFDKQLPMSKIHAPDVEIRSAFTRGRVFERLGVPGPETLPERLSPARLGGAWVRETELELLDGFGDVGFSIVPKPLWFSPVLDGPVLTREEFDKDLGRHFDGPAYPVMVSLRDADLSEVNRCFVVPEAWPQTSSK